MTRSRAAAMFVSVGAALAGTLTGPVPLAHTSVGSTAQATFRAFDCKATSGAAAEWLGGSGLWSDASKWSGGDVPGLDSRDEEACIPPGSDVVVDGSSPRIDLAALDLARDSRLSLQPGTALFVWGDQRVFRSTTRRTSVLEVDGATLGGAGRWRVMGTLIVHRSAGGVAANLSTRPVKSSVAGRSGILQIGDTGTLRVEGSGNIRIAKEYLVDVRGRALLVDDAGLRADHGTSFLLQPRARNRGVGRLVILNDRGFAAGRRDGIRDAATFVNRGSVVKREATGTSVVEGRYFGGGRVVEKSGEIRLPLPIVEGGAPGSGPCGNAHFCTAEQDATVRIPVTDADGARIEVTRADAAGVKGVVAVALRIQATDLEASFAYPAVLRLGYTAAALRWAGAPADPARLDVARAEGSGAYADIPRCESHEIPLGATSCLDVESSSRTGGGVLLVVRTVQLSRWVAH